MTEDGAMEAEAKQRAARTAGIAVSVEREGDRVAIRAAGYGDAAERLPEVAAAVRRLPHRWFRAAGTLALFRGWTPQPRPVCEAWLEDGGSSGDVRPLLLLHELESLGGAEGCRLTAEAGRRILIESFPDSECIQKRPGGGGEHGNEGGILSLSRSGEECGGSGEWSRDAAVDVLYSCGMLDLEGVEARLRRMEQGLAEREREIARLREACDAAGEARSRERPLAELGRERAGVLRREASARLRAVQLFRGARPGDGARLELIESEETEPATLREIHARVTQEFEALYPTEPRSEAAAAGRERVRWDWGRYRIGGAAGDDSREGGRRKA